MRPRLLTAALTACCLLAAPAAASAAPQIGISENQPGMLADPLFQSLGAKHVRIVVSYDVMTRGDDELARVAQYLDTANAAGIEPLVTFEHARGDAGVCVKRANRRRRQCKLPSRAAYERNVGLFLARFPYVKTISPWNEINHFTQGTARNPRRAAQYTDSVRKLCRTCTLVVADILDQADSPRSKRPTFNRTKRYIKHFRRALKAPRTICGVHNYSDVNRFRSSGTKAIIRALGCKQVWLTETGGIFRFGSSFKPSESRQLKATRYMFKLAGRNRRITRLYVYNWFGLQTPRFDAGLVAGATPRSAYLEVKRRMGR